MKSEDFERLKAICEKEGFEIKESFSFDQTYRVKMKKDEWEGVEFVELLKSQFGYLKGCIGKIINKERGGFAVFCPIGKSKSNYKPNVYYSFGNLRPSTEQAYVDQLKAKAFELFGEIKEGDGFIDWDGVKFSINTLGFKYDEKYDSLRFGGWIIYSKGKWAKKIEKVDYSINEKLERLNQLEEWIKKHLNK